MIYGRMHWIVHTHDNNAVNPVQLNATPSEVELEVKGKKVLSFSPDALIAQRRRNCSTDQLVVCNWAVKNGMTSV